LVSGADAQEEVMMNSGLHRPRLASTEIGDRAGVVVFVPLFALTIMVAVIVVGQAVATFGM
jgi:hypothetical protein